MKYDPKVHHRHSIRLKGYDYTQTGAYFVTLVTQEREHIFGKIHLAKMCPNEYGEIVQITWNDLPNHNLSVELGPFVIMPNHIHGIIILNEPDSHNLTPPSIYELIRQFKTFSARRINQKRQTPGKSVWQRNYYEHIIRTENDLEQITKYILYNPIQWDTDEENTRHNL